MGEIASNDTGTSGMLKCFCVYKLYICQNVHLGNVGNFKVEEHGDFEQISLDTKTMGKNAQGSFSLSSSFQHKVKRGFMCFFLKSDSNYQFSHWLYYKIWYLLLITVISQL